MLSYYPASIWDIHIERVNIIWDCRMYFPATSTGANKTLSSTVFHFYVNLIMLDLERLEWVICCSCAEGNLLE